MSKRRALKWCIGLAIVAGMTGFGVWHFWFTHPIGNGPAGPTVSPQAFDAPWTSRPVLLIGLGDSITAGFGARRGYSYFDRLVTNPPDEWPEMTGLCLSSIFPNLAYTNLAVSGSTSLEHEARQIPRLPTAASNTMVIVVMSTGGNDLIHNYGRVPAKEGAMFGATWGQAQPWVENFKIRLSRSLREISAKYPGGCHVFLANIYDPTDETGDARSVALPLWPDAMRILAAYNQVIERCAEEFENVHVVNIRGPFLGHGLTSRQFWRKHYRSHDPHYWYFVNLEDPNERGYDALRRIFLNEIISVREELKKQRSVVILQA